MSRLLANAIRRSPAVVTDTDGDESGIGDGFSLAPTQARVYTGPDATSRFAADLAAQEEAVAMLPAAEMTRFTPDGEVTKSGLRVTDAALSDLCNLYKIPASFIRRFANVHAEQAAGVLQTYIKQDAALQDRRLVVDADSKSILGIVSSRYKPYSHMQLHDTLFKGKSAGAKLVRGVIEGAQVRFSAISDRLTDNARVGDTVQFGFDAGNGIGGDSSVRISAYMLVLRCTNGMTSRDASLSTAWPHTLEHIDVRVRTAAHEMIDASANRLRLIQAAARHVVTQDQFVDLQKFVADPANHGSKMLAERFVSNTLDELKTDGDQSKPVSLWNAVNAVTVEAHRVQSERRRIQLEVLGMRMLTHFGTVFGLN